MRTNDCFSVLQGQKQELYCHHGVTKFTQRKLLKMYEEKDKSRHGYYFIKTLFDSKASQYHHFTLSSEQMQNATDKCTDFLVQIHLLLKWSYTVQLSKMIGLL